MRLASAENIERVRQILEARVDDALKLTDDELDDEFKEDLAE